MLRLVGNALRSRVLPSNPIPRITIRRLSTNGGEPQETPIDPFLHDPNEGLIFARLAGISRNTIKTDVIHYFEGCKLSTDDVKFEYNRVYTPIAVFLQFSSRSSFDMALRQTIIKEGRLYKLDRVDRSQWDILRSYDGKTILLQGIPRNAFQDDIERFLSGCNFDPSFEYFMRQGFSDRHCLVNFPTRLDAMNAYGLKNRGFCLNNPITMRVLQ